MGDKDNDEIINQLEFSGGYASHMELKDFEDALNKARVLERAKIIEMLQIIEEDPINIFSVVKMKKGTLDDILIIKRSWIKEMK
jgi:hypothetical protein